MPEPRDGFRYLGVQLPTPIVEAIEEEAHRQKVSVARMLAEHFREHFHLPDDVVPAPKKAGRKPKKKKDGSSS